MTISHTMTIATMAILVGMLMHGCDGSEAGTTPSPIPTTDADAGSGDAASEMEPTQDAAIDARCEYNDNHPMYCCLGQKYLCGYVSYCCCLPQTSPIDHVSCSNCDSGMSQAEECNAAYPGCCQGACVKGSC